MWSDEVLPRLRSHGLGTDAVVRTFRLTGIGESTVAEILGEEMLRRPDPEVATYARLEAIDVRISAAGDDASGTTAAARVAAAADVVLERLGDYIWAEGPVSWADAIGSRLTELGWRLAVEEIGSGGQVAALFGDVPWLSLVVARPGGGSGDDDLLDMARAVRATGETEVGVAVRVRPRGSELAVSVAVVTPDRERRQRHATYLGGSMGRSQSALITAATLFDALRG